MESRTHNCSQARQVIIDNEIQKLLKEKVIVKCDYEEDGIISSAFLKQKPDGSFRFKFTSPQTIEFLGFVINSVTMTITLNNNKKQKLKTLYANFLSRATTIKTISQVLRKTTSSFPATKFGRLHYRNLKVLKTRSLKYHKGNFNAKACYQRKQKTTSYGGKKY